MKTYSTFIFENSYKTGIITKNNKERKAELVKYLQHKDMHDYIKTLNNMLDDPKAKLLLEEGFGGDLGDTELKYSVEEIPVRNLRPTQSEIDVDKSVKYSFTKPETVDMIMFNDSKDVEINNSPIVTFRKNYVVDGHHRWSQVYSINPNATVKCFNYDGNISPIQMIKAVQGAIASVKAENGDNENIPSKEVEGKNLFDKEWNKKSIYEYIYDNITNKFIEQYIIYFPEYETKKDVAMALTNNLMELKTNNYPEVGSPNRGDMPVTTHAGRDKNNKVSSLPDSDGSALNKLKNNKFVKNAVK